LKEENGRQTCEDSRISGERCPPSAHMEMKLLSPKQVAPLKQKCSCRKLGVDKPENEKLLHSVKSPRLQNKKEGRRDGMKERRKGRKKKRKK
jgi:hypothetical protein